MTADDPQRLDAALLQVRQRGGRGHDGHVDLAAQQVVDQGRCALVRHVQHLRVGAPLQVFHHHLLERALPRAAVAQAFGGGAQRLHHLVNIRLRQVLACHQDQRRREHQGHRIEIIRAIAQVAIQQRLQDHVVDAAGQQRRAVRLGLRHAARADGAAGTTHVLDDDRLAQPFAQLRGNRPHHGVDRPARREGDDDGDRPVGPGLGLDRRGRRTQYQRGGQHRAQARTT
ncbi:hypothetical protein D3C71_1418950 [compost metagenome]